MMLYRGPYVALFGQSFFFPTRRRLLDTLQSLADGVVLVFGDWVGACAWCFARLASCLVIRMTDSFLQSNKRNLSIIFSSLLQDYACISGEFCHVSEDEETSTCTR